MDTAEIKKRRDELEKYFSELYEEDKEELGEYHNDDEGCVVVAVVVVRAAVAIVLYSLLSLWIVGHG